MSQNKTIIPGFDDARGHEDGMRGLYNRSDTASDRTKTYIPDIYKKGLQDGADTPSRSCEEDVKIQSRTMVGTLFSISRLSTGELFPIYVGRNTIGSDPECDISLAEETVSPKHAVLLVRAIVDDEGRRQLRFYLTDYDSEYGTRLGDVALEYDKMECHDHDVITVGRSYKFLLCLFDAAGYGLFVDSEFKQIYREPGRQGMSTGTDGRSLGGVSAQNYANTIGEEDEASFYGRTKKQENDHSTNKTVIL